MASISTQKRLSELLEEKQEPFVLETYLDERGCKRKSSGFEGNSFGSTRNFGLHGRRVNKRIGSSTHAAKICSRIAKDLCKKLVCINEIIRMKGWNFTVGEFSDDVKRRKNKIQATAMEDSGRLSSGSFSTDFNSCSGSDIDDMAINVSQRQQTNHQSDKEAAEWRMIKENRQCSPVSVLDEIEMISNVTSFGDELKELRSRLSFSFPNMKKATEESIFSGTSNRSCSQHTNSKKSLEQTRQLLFDCVRETVESKEGRLIGPEKLAKIICENIRSWDKQRVNLKKITKLVRSDLLNSFVQHDILEGFREEIVKEIGDEILDEMIDEIVHLNFLQN